MTQIEPEETRVNWEGALVQRACAGDVRAFERLYREHVGRVLKHSVKMRDTLGKFRVAVIRKHAERLEYLILESFNQLLRKSNLVMQRHKINMQKMRMTNAASPQSLQRLYHHSRILTI